MQGIMVEHEKCTLKCTILVWQNFCHCTDQEGCSYTFHISPEAKPPATKTHHFFRPCKNTRDLNNLENSIVSLML